MKKTIKNRGSFTTVKLRAISLRLIAIIALAVVIGFSMAACDNGDDDTGGNNNNNGGNNDNGNNNNGNNDNGGNSDTGGTFTVTGIPSEYNGKYTGFQGGNEKAAHVGVQSYDTTTEVFTLVQIANGSVNLPMWTYDYDDGNVTIERYSGNDTLFGYIAISNSATPDGSVSIANRGWTSITFSNGSAARTWSSGSDTTPGPVPEDDDD